MINGLGTDLETNMSDAAVFQATYADMKSVKTRGVIQIVLEIPVEMADRAYQVLGGFAVPSQERWVAVARLNAGAAIQPQAASHNPQPGECDGSENHLCSETPSDVTPTIAAQDVPAPARQLTPAQRAAVLCKDTDFWGYLHVRHLKPLVASEDDAAKCLRELCHIQSRAELIPGSRAAVRFALIDVDFQDWLLPGVGKHAPAF